MKISSNRKGGTVFAADLPQLQEALAKPARPLIVLTGQLVLSSLSAATAVDGYVAMAPRQLEREVPFKKTPSKSLSVWLQKEASLLLSRSSGRVCFAVDALLKYGQRHKSIDDLLVLTASAGADKSIVLALRFKKGALESVRDFELAASGSHTFDADLHTTVERCRTQYPGAALHWSGPLAAPKSFEFVLAPDSTWAHAPIQALTTGSGVRFLQAHGLSIFIVAASVAGYCGALYVPYKDYTLAATSITEESQALKGEYAFAAARLDLLRSQSKFLERGAKAPERLKLLESVLSSVGGVKGAKVLEVKLYMERKDEPTTPGSRQQLSSDIEIVIEVPAAEADTALEQSIPLLGALRDSLGLDFRLTPGDGMKETTGADKGLTRTYRIIGALPRA